MSGFGTKPGRERTQRVVGVDERHVVDGEEPREAERDHGGERRLEQDGPAEEEEDGVEEEAEEEADDDLVLRRRLLLLCAWTPDLSLPSRRKTARWSVTHLAGVQPDVR